MKLYFAPGACSLAPHIVLREAGFPFELEKVNLAKRQTASGEDYTRVNPKGYVPALRLDDGEMLTEVAVILQYLADQKPESALAPQPGTMQRYRLMEWLNFIATEVHKPFGALYNPRITEDSKASQLALLRRRLDYLTTQFNGKPYLMGETFTVADAYLFTVLNWSHFLKVDLSGWPKLQDYLTRLGARSAIREAMSAEGLPV